jgi:Xaa-Pro aminopeptidase
MVVAIEPKLIFPGNGVVGIENTFRVTAKGLVPFTQFPGGIQLL